MALDHWLWMLAQAASGNTPKTEQILEWMNTNPAMGWFVAGFAVFALAVAAVAKLTGNLDNIIGFFDKYRPKKQEITAEVRQRLRRELIEVELGQVVKRLEDSLHHKVRLDLRYQEELERIGRRDKPPTELPPAPNSFIHRVFNPFNMPPPPAPVELEVSTVALLQRDDIQGRLLILGEPGAGKTNELLSVAKDLLQQAKQSDDAPIPVIFELSEWSADPEKTFADWLEAQLYDKYELLPEVSQHWIQHGQLFPLLDGLDELRRVDDVANLSSAEVDRKRQAKQIQCMRTINTFLDVHPSPSMVVCCRRKEYEALESQGEYLKRLNGAIYLKELDDDQIESYLDASNRSPLWDALKTQPALLDLVRSPLFLLMAVVTYQGQPIHNSDQLLDLYIEKQLSDLNNQGAYPPGKPPSAEQTHHYLSWLATQLERQEVTEFLIERLQPSWLDREHDKRLYELNVGLVFLVRAILAATLVITAFTISFLLPTAALPIGFTLGLYFGLVFLLIKLFSGWTKITSQEIELAETLTFSWRQAISSGMAGVLKGSVMVGVFVGLVFGLTVGLRTGLALAAVAGLFSGLLMGLRESLDYGLKASESEIDDKQLPNQGIRRTLSVGITAWIFSSMLYGIYGALIVGLISTVIDNVSFGLAYVVDAGLAAGFSAGIVTGFAFDLDGGIMIGLKPVIQHFCLRVVLHRSGVAPWNYERFLDHAENHRFIQRVGGRYRFVHDLLRKRFAERYQPRWR